jgi:cell division septum initiation protein DivIVA
MPQNGVYDLLKMLEIALDEGYSVLKYTIVNKREIEDLIDRIYAALPNEVQEARLFLKRKEELQNEAQQKAAKIVQDAQAEADRKLSESDQIKAIEREGVRITNEVKDNCEKIKNIAIQDADGIRLQATDEAVKIREGAELYAEQVLTSLEGNLAQLQQVVKNGQIHLEQLRSDAISRYSSQAQENSRDWVSNRENKRL